MSFSSKNLSAFYFQLGTMIQVGMPIQSALLSLRETAPRSMRSTVVALSDAVNAGMPPSEAMEQCGNAFAALDRHSISVTERSGALDVGLLSLSKYYETRASARNKLIDGSLYPAFVFIIAVFIPPLPGFILGRTTFANYLWHTAGLLVGLAIIAWLIKHLVLWSFTIPKMNLFVDRVFMAVPIFGRLRFDYALSQWISSVRLMMVAGIGVVDALEYASRTTPSPLIRDAYQRAAAGISSGLQVSHALETTGVFPNQFIQYWRTGEQSGRMDEMLDRLAAYYEDRWRRSLDFVVTWLPRIAYGFVAAYMIWQIFTQATAYFNMYNTFLGD